MRPGPPDIENLLGQLAGQANIGVALLDERGRYVYVNGVIAEIHSGTARDIAGRTLQELAPGLAETAGAVRAEILRSGKAALGVRIAGTIDAAGTGDHRSWRASYHPLRLGDSRFIGVIAEETTAEDQMRTDRAELAAALLETAERERGRLAEALHDDALQTLLFLNHECDDLAVRVGDEAIAPARSALHRTIDSLRALVADLHPVALGPGGLSAGVRDLVDEHAALAGFAATLHLDVEIDGMQHGALLLRLLRELLMNVVKHARAEHVEVTIGRGRDGWRMAVVDDGVGTDPQQIAAAAARGHVGIASCAWRLESVGGLIDVGPHVRGGTVAEVLLPFESQIEQRG